MTAALTMAWTGGASCAHGGGSRSAGPGEGEATHLPGEVQAGHPRRVRGVRPHRRLLPCPSVLEGLRVEELPSDGRVEIEDRRSRVVAGPVVGEPHVGVHIRDGCTN